ncbi:hypothetical protein DICPUDRAFT_38439, partial [Dictyostelium purpureum]
IMKRIALLFPGQGSQIVGMGKDLVKDFPYIAPLYNQTDKVLKYPLTNLMFNGPSEELKQTDNTQPALLLHSFSILKIIEKELGYCEINERSNDFTVSKEFINRFDFMLGHSLGEYSALASSNSLSFYDALQLVRQRGQLMKQAQPGIMAALLSKKNMFESGSLEELKKISNQLLSENIICNISNINSPNQIVISGSEEGVNKLIEIGKKNKLFVKSVKLEVSAAFHSELMKPCSDSFKIIVDQVQFNTPETKIISNVNCLPYSNIDRNNELSIQSLLSKQLSSTVNWSPSIQYCINEWKKENLNDEDFCFVEMGSNNVLSELLKQIYPNAKSKSIQSTNDIKEFIKDFKK